MHPAIEVHDLTKSFGPVHAVDGLTLSVAPGEVLALLGPNGAGKTTTVACIEGYLRPDRGSVRVLGLDPVRQHARLFEDLGVMLQSGGAWQAATPRQMVKLYARFYEEAADPEGLLAEVDLLEASDRSYRSLSGGEQQRLHLALALVGRPRVVVLDEPTAGLDPHARRRVWQLVEDLRADGVTILLTTHMLDEAGRLADRVAVMDRGRLLACDSPDALAAAGRAVVVRSPATIDSGALAAALGTEVSAEGGGRWRVRAGSEAIPMIAAWFAEQDLPLTELSAAGDSLEDVFLRLTADPPQATDAAGTPDGSPPAPTSTPLPGTDASTLTRAGKRLVAQAGMELRLLARNGENLLVTLGIPAGLLVFFTLVEVLPTDEAPAVDFLLPRMLTVAVMGSALVATAISTGFERSYFVLKRLGATPLRRRELVGAKAAAVLATVAVQVLVLVLAALALGWPQEVDPAAGSWPVALGGITLGVLAFAGLGLLLAGTLRASATLALANALFVALLLSSGLLFPLDVLPGAVQAVASLLPSAALAEVLDAALDGSSPAAASWVVLAAWALTTPVLAAWRFRWE